ncbi:MAG: NAD-dependent deacylase [Melioribacteraceae bacterium]|nr:NAD-dependent deacylase [Melioribacteraceae bacterium]MCF8393334.1 NAD-dependent deacylase [Melioribacteraceae bacterium]MCF8418899.1 NAD-dependent deacylase [Melioribacteraceae bacterium]
MKFNDHFLSKLKTAQKVVFFTGAGISAESGISTFRGKDGIWNKLKPEELASFDAFMRNPKLVWEWYQYRRKIAHDTKPNLGHEAIKQFEKLVDEVTVVTQNVDNLHNRAGSKNVLELHGNIERNYCTDCRTFFSPDEISKLENESGSESPRCSKCSGLIRPDVVWFGEFLPQDVFSEAERKASGCDICFVVGTSAIVYPAAYIPITARQSGAFIVEVNIESTEMTRIADESFFGKAGEVLPKIVEKAKEIRIN